MFNCQTIIPSQQRVGPVTFSSYYSTLAYDQIKEELDVLSRCNRNQFYELVKNQPLRYLSLIEHNGEIQTITRKFDFTITRIEDLSGCDAPSRVSVAIRPYDSDPITEIVGADCKVAEELKCRLKARAVVARQDIMLPKRQIKQPVQVNEPKIDLSTEIVKQQLATILQQNEKIIEMLYKLTGISSLPNEII